ncbi:bifunctional alpha/beta hydrolase/OsmC family protein [Citromicrobium bathyomarinum]|uniref:bifunctional alpha/beta hydrolase/OsmC family protein n=1 Tax=Sphingomonadales TaxID=204457 RepID=UPI000C3F2859|nr:bifunctional alpha/beta hydrolase/OsmC family protein [Citromicrobium sp.]MBO80254.1 hydrolase [Citromicrobium sp.]MBO82447.1 hydrolase [Citromicrobium sp.]
MPTEQITIETARGYELAGSLELPTGLVRGAALFAHCFTCTKQSKAAVEVTRALARQGIACLRFDFTGLGGSGGDFGRAGFASDVEDLVVSANHLCERFGGQILLIGHSLGGAAVLAAADMIGRDRVAAIATIGAPADVPHVLGNIEGDLDAIERDGSGEVTIGGRAFHLSREFLDKTRAIDLPEEVARLKLPILIAHSPTDGTVGIENASQLFEAARHPKSFISLAGADHLLTDAEDAHFIADMIAAWGARYIPMRQDWPMPEKGVVVCSGNGKFGTEVHTPSHRFVADEPRSYGGDDTGPTPYDLLLAALGTCTAMTMKMYADRKGLPFEGARVAVTHERDHGKDCDHCEEEGSPVQALHRTITLQGDDLSAEQRDRLIEIADKCPVHRTLEGHLHIHTARED